MSYVDIDPQNDPATIKSEQEEALEERFPGWFAPAASLIFAVILVVARLISITRGLAAEMRAAAFRSFGEKIIGVPAVGAAPATVQSTWTLADTNGHTIEAGTKLTIAGPGEPQGFEVVADVVVPPGSSVTGAGAVTLRAKVAGTAGNGLTAAPDLVTALSFVNPGGVVLVGATSGGVDAEGEDEYLDGLKEELTLLSLSPITEEDLAKDALRVPGIARCLVIGGYEPTAATEGHPLIACDFPVDAAGANMSAERKEELKARQQAKSPSGCTVYVADPTRTKVTVKTQVAVLAGFEPAAVAAAVKARLAEFLSPAKWGTQGQQGESPAGAWKNATKVYYNELISLVDRVPGVDRVVSLESKKGAGSFEKVDITLASPAPLAESGTHEVTTL